ncbi:MAG: hypothetical protein ACKVPY_17725 [Paracoccaceae bacterium]
MVGPSKILTVSYGTFSCTLEGFEEPFSTMKAIAEYFRDLAADDRYFGAEPPQPDAEMLGRIAEREIQRRVEAKVNDGGIVLRQLQDTVAPPAPASAAPPATAVAASPSPPAQSASVGADARPAESVAAKLMRIRAAVAAARQAAAPAGYEIEETVLPAAAMPFPEPVADAVPEAVADTALSGNVEPEAAQPEAAQPGAAQPGAAQPAEAIADAPDVEPATESASENAPEIAVEAEVAADHADIAVAEEPAQATAETLAADAPIPAEPAADEFAAESIEPAAPQPEVAAEAAPVMAETGTQDDPSAPAEVAETPAEASAAGEETESGPLDLEAVLARVTGAEVPPTPEAPAGDPAPDATETAYDDEDETSSGSFLSRLAARAASEARAEDAGPAQAGSAGDRPEDQIEAPDDDMIAAIRGSVGASQEDTAADPAGLADEAPPSEAAHPGEIADEAEADTSEPAHEPAEAASEPEPAGEADLIAALSAEHAPETPEPAPATGAASEAEADEADEEAALIAALSAGPAPEATEPELAAAAADESAPAEADPVPAVAASEADAEPPAVADEAAAMAPEPEPAPRGLIGRARARVIKVRRSIAEGLSPAHAATPVHAATPAAAETPAASETPAAPLVLGPADRAADTPGDLPAAAEAAPGTATDTDADPVLASIGAALGDTPLTDDDEADLIRQLADAADDTTDRRDPHEGREILEVASRDEDAAVERLMEETNSKLEGVENRRRFSAISHLKAAVAATVADRKLKLRDPGSDPRPSEEGIDLYRNDLSKAVRPRRPAAEGATATRRPQVENRPAPLVLVSEYRVDRPSDAAREAAMVRPRRISAGNLALSENEDDIEPEAEAPLSPDEARSFAEFAERLGAANLPDLLEAAAVYTATVEGLPHFSRPHVLRKVASATDEADFNREDGLRSFGLLLRQGKIQKVRRGQFAVTETSRFMSEARSASR